MSSFFSKKKSPLGQLKGQFFGNPELSLKEAYEAASKIKSIENHYFSGYRVPVESLTNDRLQAEVQQNLAVLQGRIEEFNANNSDNLTSNQMEKLIFAEGILANYTMGSNQSSALMPVSQPNIANPALGAPRIDVPPNPITPVANNKKTTPPTPQRKRQDGLSTPSPLQGSLGKTVNKFKQDLNPNPRSEQEVVDQFRRSRTITIVGVRLLILLIIVPLLTQQITKRLIFVPMVEEYRGGEEAVATIDNLNSEWKEEALEELSLYEEQLKMDHLLRGVPPMAPEIMEEKVQAEANEIAETYYNKSTNAISNVFADIVALFAFAVVLLIRRNDINLLKSFIDNIVYGLSDSAKAFAIILVTDIFVGFHSPHGWEVLLEGLANHLGVAPNQSWISLFIATVPVVMDTIAKYWIFRYLSQMSASTVATLKEMDD